MENILDMLKDINIKMDELTDDQRQSNYCRLLSAIEHIENEKRITEDWMEEQKRFVLEMYYVFDCGFENCNPEITDKEFKRMAKEADTILSNLITSINYEKTFKVKQYHSLLTRIVKMITLINSSDDLCDFMQRMKLG